jgi:DsbC/DsbD-like thiol-disulfide interchange protein
MEDNNRIVFVKGAKRIEEMRIDMIALSCEDICVPIFLLFLLVIARQQQRLQLKTQQLFPTS